MSKQHLYTSPSEPVLTYLKYLVYLLLAINVGLFLQLEWGAAEHIFRRGVPLSELISAFVATIDTLSWLILLLMFELETYQISDEKLTPGVSRVLRTLRGVCYGFIVYACYGYIRNALSFPVFVPADGMNLCQSGIENLAQMIGQNEFVLITSENCVLSKGTLLFSATINAVVAEDDLTRIVRLEWIDVINSVTWILVVLNLELDLYLLRKGWFEGLIETVSKRSKLLLYLVLGMVAVYWGIFGDFLDLWDALLWIFAFFFIEQNVVEWERELEETDEHAR